MRNAHQERCAEDSRTRVLLAAVALAQRGERLTVRTVAVHAERSVQVTHRALRELRTLGLVGFEDDHDGTLRVTCETIAVAA